MSPWWFWDCWFPWYPRGVPHFSLTVVCEGLLVGLCWKLLPRSRWTPLTRTCAGRASLLHASRARSAAAWQLPPLRGPAPATGFSTLHTLLYTL